APRRALPSFPTRRSSDLKVASMAIRVHAFTDDALGADDATGVAHRIATGAVSATEAVEAAIERVERIDPQLRSVQFPDFDRARRSEEHTSELQSRFDLVC